MVDRYRASDEETIAACPECDTAEIYKRRPGIGRSYRLDSNDPEFRCTECGAEFDDYNERPYHNQGAINHPGGAAKYEHLSVADIPALSDDTEAGE